MRQSPTTGLEHQASERSATCQEKTPRKHASEESTDTTASDQSLQGEPKATQQAAKQGTTW
jgi:hypothetical protein